MSGPGDRAPKDYFRVEPTHCPYAEGHGGDPTNVDLDHPLTPGSKNSARSQLTPAREPGDLGEASPLMVGGKQLQEGLRPQSAKQRSEKSDVDVVPKKSTKTRVTPVEPMEGRSAAKGNPLHETRSQLRVGKVRPRTCSGSDNEQRKSHRSDSQTCSATSGCHFLSRPISA